ncbi:MAG: helicase-exonuclease AddAB subunit AddA [Lachnospiraceae bacterium]|nr:helicase-exonuclease AddAB subunit AddA [Lachnospiraceae bacterium]
MSENAVKKAISFTDEQQEAIDVRDADVLVSAAAGSGKTAVLAERIVRLVSEGEDPVDIDRILVVTFTRAAAAGMRERIGRALSERIRSHPSDARLRHQEMLLPHAKIMTIDAFCQYLLRNSFASIGLDPSFRVSDGGEMQLLESEVLQGLLEELYRDAAENGGSVFPDLAECISEGSTDRRLEKEILELYRFAQSMPWPALWLKTYRERAEREQAASLNELSWCSGLYDRILKELECAIGELQEALAIASSPGGPGMYCDTITNDIEILRRLCASEDLQTLLEQLAPGKALFGRLPQCKSKEVDPARKDQAMALRNGAKDAVGYNSERYCSFPPEVLLQDERRAARTAAELLRVTALFLERMEAAKHDANIVDFPDMEHLALRILAVEPEDLKDAFRPVPTDTAKEYAAYFREIMIDEYQDSNYVQELILQLIAGDRHDRFMVGDVKQSIYRFRLARPEIFMEKFGRYTTGQGTERRVDLHRNFRSRPEILDFVNDIFARLMFRDIGGVEYDADALLRFGGDLAELPQAADGRFVPEVLLTGGAVQPEEEPEDEEDPDEPEAEELPEEAYAGETENAEAVLVAERIRRMVGEELVRDKEQGLRRVRYGDIVILLRSASGVDEAFRQVLTDRGIPVYSESKSGYFNAAEVRVLTDLFRTLENPLRDIPLAGVMHSILAGFDNEELARIRGGEGTEGLPLYEALRACADCDEDNITDDIYTPALIRHCRNFLQWLEKWRRASGRLSVRELLEEIFAETGYPELVAAMPAGARRRANVQMLLIRAAQFESSGGHGLGAFVDRLERYRKGNVDFGEANELSDDADMVRIMTIHKSKGLEFPVVFLCDLSRKFNRSDERAAVLTDEQIGPAPYAVNLENRTKHSTLRRHIIADKVREDSLGEELRVLYVAMTRAMDKLILTACVEDAGVKGLMERMEEARGRTVPSGGAPAGVSYLKRRRAAGYFDLLKEVLPELRVPFLLEQPAGNGVQDAGKAAQTQEKDLRSAVTDAVNKKNIDSYLMDEYERNMRFSYAHRDLENLCIKTTVTELKEKLLHEEGENFCGNDLIGPEKEAVSGPGGVPQLPGPGGAERGTLYHKVMEILDAEILGSDVISNPDSTSESLELLLKWMKNREGGALPSGASDIVRPEDVLAFLRAPLGQRFIRAYRAGALYREKQFMMSIDAARVNPAVPAGETVLLQGVIDAYFVEDNGIILFDYKTDRVKEDPAELAEKYGVQLSLYAEALERLTDLPVREKWIWSFSLGRAIDLSIPRSAGSPASD